MRIIYEIYALEKCIIGVSTQHYMYMWHSVSLILISMWYNNTQNCRASPKGYIFYSWRWRPRAVQAEWRFMVAAKLYCHGMGTIYTWQREQYYAITFQMYANAVILRKYIEIEFIEKFCIQRKFIIYIELRSSILYTI